MNTKSIKKQVFVEQIPAHALNEILQKNHFKIIDVREPQAILDQGSIPGALNIPFEQLDDKLIEWKQEQNRSIRQKPLLFCCTGGVLSYMAALKALEKGLQSVYNLEGGHSAWMRDKSC